MQVKGKHAPSLASQVLLAALVAAVARQPSIVYSLHLQHSFIDAAPDTSKCTMFSLDCRTMYASVARLPVLPADDSAIAQEQPVMLPSSSDCRLLHAPLSLLKSRCMWLSLHSLELSCRLSETLNRSCRVSETLNPSFEHAHLWLVLQECGQRMGSLRLVGHSEGQSLHAPLQQEACVGVQHASKVRLQACDLRTQHAWMQEGLGHQGMSGR